MRTPDQSCRGMITGLMKEHAMNCDEFRKEWPLVKNRVRTRWPGLSEREINRIDGRTDLLYRALVHTCGVRRDDAARQLFEFLRAPATAEPPIGHG